MIESGAFTPQLAASPEAQLLWLIPALPMAAAGIASLLKQGARRSSAALAIGSMSVSLLISLAAFFHSVGLWTVGQTARETVNFAWLHFGSSSVELGWILDPLSAVMLVMVCFVGLLIFIYSTGYMAHDERFGRFFCFLALFAGGMLTVVIANSLLLLFMGWEIVGLTSYLLIGFWYHKPSAAAAAKKAFLTTRVGDIFFLLGMVWLAAQTGTLLFYNNGTGSIESSAIATLLSQPAAFGLSAATVVGLLIFAGAVGKSGQLPLHVWLPDAMEGPTPVSALIHAATMVAAGVYLVARVYPLMNGGLMSCCTSPTLNVVTWVGASTAIFAALIAVAQNDIKRILAYSTVSQLGYMMAGIGMGGVAVGMFHLITHAFFKALLFMGAGSVIHGCHEEQDIRKMGGLKADMPWTFVSYAVGMMALSGVPIFFSGFWSKDAILEAAFHWTTAKAPFYMLVVGALLTVFYMTRQVLYVFFGTWRGHHPAHESPAVMTVPLAILAFFAMALGLLGTPVLPLFRSFLNGEAGPLDITALAESEFWLFLGISTVIVSVGFYLGYKLYGREPIPADAPDPLEASARPVWTLLANKFYIDELYEATLLRFYAWWGTVSDFLDRAVWGGIVTSVARLFALLATFNRFLDSEWVNGAFDKSCEELAHSGGLLARVQNGQAQRYLRILAIAVAVLAAILIWSSRA